MSVNIFNHPFLSGLIGAPPMVELFSAKADIAAMLEFERALAQSQAALGIIPTASCTAIENAIAKFNPDMDALNHATSRDGVVVPGLLKQLRISLDTDVAEHLHFGATSQDVIDTSLTLRLKSALALLSDDINKGLDELANLDARFGKNNLMARTRMQNALETNVADHLALWRRPLQKLADRLPQIVDEVALLQLGGPVGDGRAFDDDYAPLTHDLAKRLGLRVPENSWHTDRTSLTTMANFLAQISSATGKIGQDISLLTLNEIGDIMLTNTGASSVMAHKSNPIKAETLVALAGFNATQLGGMHQAALHENHRSGSAWTLEWMLLPQMAMASAASLRISRELLNNVEKFGKSSR